MVTNQVRVSYYVVITVAERIYKIVALADKCLPSYRCVSGCVCVVECDQYSWWLDIEWPLML